MNERSAMIVKNSNTFQRNFLIMVSGLRGYLLTEEMPFRQNYDSALKDNRNILNELGSLVSSNADQLSLLRDIEELQQYWIDEFAAPLLEANHRVDSERDRSDFNKLYKDKSRDRIDRGVQSTLQVKFAEFINLEYKRRASDQENLVDAARSAKSISLYLAGISLLVGGCISAFIANYISSRMVKMIRMANEIARGNYGFHIAASGKGEFGQLAHELNSMALILDNNFQTLKRQKEELDQFAHIVSHDLKAPLRGIDNIIGWIEEDHAMQLPKAVNEYLQLIKGRIVRAEKLLQGVLMYAKAGHFAQETEPVNVKELISEISIDLTSRMSIRLEVQPELPVILAERVPLQQVFTNLIVNAFKYHDKKDGFVKVYYHEEKDTYRFFVEDDGPGIPKAYRQKVFGIFQTLQERDAVESVGAGLAIVKKILTDRKMEIQIKDTVSGVGTVFEFSWPKLN